MSRIPTPASIEASPEAAQALLQGVKAQLGSVPNLHRIIANSPAALEGYIQLGKALAKGRLDARTRERIALAVAQVNGCDYCLSAHSYIGKNLVHLDEAEITANRHGSSYDAEADAAVKFAVAIVKERGHVSEAALKAVKDAGYDDSQLVEIVTHVALNTLTNYVNEVFKTDIDFPAAGPLTKAA